MHHGIRHYRVMSMITILRWVVMAGGCPVVEGLYLLKSKRINAPCNGPRYTKRCCFLKTRVDPMILPRREPAVLTMSQQGV